MNNKYFKFHFKNNKMDKATSYDLELKDFSGAIEFAYNKLEKLNGEFSGYRIIGIYEILIGRDNYVPGPKTN
mgnify:CR=1 FL=1